MKFLQTRPQVENMNNIFYDIYYIVLKYGKEKENIEDNTDFENKYFMRILFRQFIILEEVLIRYWVREKWDFR